MGRELRRVPLDFDWPLNKVWKGFINPRYKKCPEDQKTCFTGQTADRCWLDAICWFITTVADDALDGGRRLKNGGKWPHPYLSEFQQAPHHSPPSKLGMAESLRWLQNKQAINELVLPPTKAFVEFYKALTKEQESFFGFMGGSGTYRIEQALLRAAGLPDDWGLCPVCKGEGQDPAVKEAYDSWKAEDPPTGEGWQLWETVSEGSPISPVFPTRDTFIAYLVKEGYSQKAAENFAKDGWVPSMIVQDGNMYKNIEASEILNQEK